MSLLWIALGRLTTITHQNKQQPATKTTKLAIKMACKYDFTCITNHCFPQSCYINADCLNICWIICSFFTLSQTITIPSQCTISLLKEVNTGWCSNTKTGQKYLHHRKQTYISVTDFNDQILRATGQFYETRPVTNQHNRQHWIYKTDNRSSVIIINMYVYVFSKTIFSTNNTNIYKNKW